MRPTAFGSRARGASALLVLGLALPLVVWLVTGWSAVRAAQANVEIRARASQRDAEHALGASLAARLSALRDAEARRPYFHYQNLFHDPAAMDNGASVVPSPLAAPPSDPIVWTYFQIDVDGKLTVPTVNEDLPELNADESKGGRRALDVLRSAKPELVALATDATPKPKSNPSLVAQNDDTPMKQQSQVLKNDAYQQNAAANQVYVQLKTKKSVTNYGEGSVTVTIDPLRFAVARFAGDARLVALRTVATPAGELVQGIVFDLDAALASVDASRRAKTRIELDASPRSDDEVPLSLASGAVRVSLPPPTIAAISAEKEAIERAFLVRFVPIAFVALFAGALVIVVVAQTERLARTRSRFAAAAAHELRTPLAGLRLYGEMLAGDLGDPAQSKKYAQRVADEAARLGRVVTNVLGFSQLERGALRVQPKRGDLGAAIAEPIERLRASLEALGATLVFEAPETLEASFDRDAVAQILHNLVDNAEKYARGADDRTIVVSVRRANDVVELSVEDRGPGVPRALRRALFSPFARSEEKDAPAGIGLGLALSRALARAQGGDLRCDDVPRGARFTLVVPAA